MFPLQMQNFSKPAASKKQEAERRCGERINLSETVLGLGQVFGLRLPLAATIDTLTGSLQIYPRVPIESDRIVLAWELAPR